MPDLHFQLSDETPLNHRDALVWRQVSRIFLKSRFLSLATAARNLLGWALPIRAHWAFIRAFSESNVNMAHPSFRYQISVPGQFIVLLCAAKERAPKRSTPEPANFRC